MGLPVIASDWGGPADYLDPSCGILIAPEGAEQFPQAIASAIEALASDPARRAAMGLQGVEKVRREFDWEVKVDRVVGIYEAVISQGRLSS
jgi:glycosyltransferase involved in cell wall biosynthesis